jgi:hypothetical protein
MVEGIMEPPKEFRDLGRLNWRMLENEHLHMAVLELD